jgi:predicted nuclease of predicted toxin-antitoxin system
MKDEMNYQDIENQSENEINPRLRFDAFMAGVKDGGLRSVSSINLLVCYMVANLNGKVTADNIIKSVDEGMLANHFEISDAISKLKSSGIIIENEDGMLSLIDDSDSSIELIERDLPLTVRERSINICQKIIAREKYKRENKAEIIETDKGYNVNLHISDKDTDFMNLTLYTATKDQAEIIKEKFITNPINVYETLIDAIFNE